MSQDHALLRSTEKFSATLHILAGQTRSILEDTVRIEQMNNATGNYDRHGHVAMLPITSRHATTPYVEVPYSRRKLTVKDYGIAEFIDKVEDVEKAAINPQSSIVSTFLAASNKNIDHIIINEGLLGKASSPNAKGQETLISAPTAIVHNNDNMSVSKIKDAIRRLGNKDVDMASERPYLVLTYNQYHALLSDNEFINKDFKLTSQEQISPSRINEILGVDIRIVSSGSNLLPKDSNNIRTCVMYTKSSVILGIQNRFSIEMGKDFSRNASTAIICKSNAGAVRMEEDRVVPILCKET